MQCVCVVLSSSVKYRQDAFIVSSFKRFSCFNRKNKKCQTG